MPATKIKEFLDRNDIPYISITHSQAYTAQQVAASAHIPGKEMVKTVMVRVADGLAMAVLPASYHVDFNMLKEVSGEENLRLAFESEFRDVFPDCEVGAMPPFGNLYGMPVFMAESLVQNEEIAFNAGTHTEVIRMSCNDFMRLVEPRILRFSVH